MCLIAFSWKNHPRYQLALVANRDEFHARPTLPAQAHVDAPAVYGGRDLEKGGSWLLVSRHGRFAAVTNVRAGLQPEAAARSRGELVDDYVKSSMALDAFVERLSIRAMEYGRFNLLLGDGERLLYAGNHPYFRVEEVSPGLHALSNGDLNAPWPKALRARDALASWLAASANTVDQADTDTREQGIVSRERDEHRRSIGRHGHCLERAVDDPDKGGLGVLPRKRCRNGESCPRREPDHSDTVRIDMPFGGPLTNQRNHRFAMTSCTATPAAAIAAMPAQPKCPHRMRPKGEKRMYIPTNCWRK